MCPPVALLALLLAGMLASPGAAQSPEPTVAQSPTPTVAQSPTPAAPVQISLLADAYSPVHAQVEAGTIVVWRHSSGAIAPHSVTSQPGAAESFDSSPNCTGAPTQDCIMPGSAGYQRRFDTIGGYPYYCRVHGVPDVPPDPSKGQSDQPCGMCGLLVVAPPPPPTPTPPPPTPTPRVVPSGVPRTPGPAFVVAGRASPEPTPEPQPTPDPFEPTPTFAAVVPISTPEVGNAGAGAGLAVVLAAGAVAVGLVSAGYLAWRRRAGGPL